MSAEPRPLRGLRDLAIAHGLITPIERQTPEQLHRGRLALASTTSLAGRRALQAIYERLLGV